MDIVVMDHTLVGEREHVIDHLESGSRTSSGEDACNQANMLYIGRDWSGSVGFDGSIRIEDCIRSCNHVMSIPEVTIEDEALKTDKKSGVGDTLGLLEEKKVKGQSKPKTSKKPPRPPRGPSLDAADLKLIKEISELARLKRARIERMKALKKMKAAKAAPDNSNLYAMVITILFCLVIIFQGMFFRGTSHTNFRGSPEAAVAATGGLFSVQYYKNLSNSDTEGPGLLHPVFVDQASESSSQQEGRRMK